MGFQEIICLIIWLFLLIVAIYFATDIDRNREMMKEVKKGRRGGLVAAIIIDIFMLVLVIVGFILVFKEIFYG